MEKKIVNNLQVNNVKENVKLQRKPIMEGKLTGYPSIDKPWLKYYDKKLLDSDIPRDTLYGYVYSQNKDYLDSVVFNYFDTKITYRELFDQVDKIAKGLVSLGIKKGDMVTIGMASTPEAYYSLYAVNKIGAVADIIDMFGNTVENLRKCLNETNSKYLLINDLVLNNVMDIIDKTNVEKIVTARIDQSLPFRLPDLPDIKFKSNNMLMNWEDFIENGKNETYTDSSYVPNDLVVLEHTGGTSGFPKGCMLTNDGLNGHVWQLSNSPLQFKRGEVWLGLMPIFASFGLMGGHLAISQGLESVLVPFYEPQKFVDLLEKYKPDRYACSPAYLEALLNDPRAQSLDVKNMKNPLIGGDTLNSKTEKAINNLLKNGGNNTIVNQGYSLTECSAGSTCNMGKGINKKRSVGIPLSKINCKIVNPDTLEELGYNEYGEICLNGTNVMMGYYNKVKETNDSLKIHSDGKLWLHTGDVGKIDEDGFLYLTDRIKRIIIRNDGCKVYPSFIEQEILNHPDVLYCSVVGVRDYNFVQGELPYAYVVLNDQRQKSIEEIKKEINDLCVKNLPLYSIPINYDFVDSLKKTKVGKVDCITLKSDAEQKIKSKKLVNR